MKKYLGLVALLSLASCMEYNDNLNVAQHCGSYDLQHTQQVAAHCTEETDSDNRVIVGNALNKAASESLLPRKTAPAYQPQ